MIGNQIPRIRIEPDRVGTDGIGAALLMDQYGLALDEWQRLVLDAWLGFDKEGKYTVTSGSLSCSRQNGKNVIIESREFYGLVVNGERILHTAHQVRTTKKAFRRLEAMFTDDRHPEIKDLVKQIHYAKGEECIELKNGGMIEYTSRSRQAARGYDGISLVVYDEAQELQEDQAEAIMATLSASATGTRQLLYIGTPNYVGCRGDVFRRLRDSCIAQSENVGAFSWHEWSVAAESITDVDVNDKKLWYEANPALGTRLTEEFTAQEAATLAPDGFCRERLGIWFKNHSDTIIEETVIDPEKWAECGTLDPKPEGKTAYAVKFSNDGTEVVLCGACLDADSGKVRVEMIRREPIGLGLQWVADWLRERYKQASCVVIDGRNGTEVLIDRIRDVWIFRDSVIKPSAQDAITAATMFVTEINEGTVTWYKKQEMLDISATTAIKRKIGSGWGLGGSDSAPVEGCAYALWGCRTSKRNPKKRMRIG